MTKAKADNGDMAAPISWPPDPNAPAESCFDLERELATLGAACALELANDCDKAPADAPARAPSDCPHCDRLDKQRQAHAASKCAAPRIVQ